MPKKKIQQTTAYVTANRPDLAEPLQAWWDLQQNPEATKKLLLHDDPRVSVIDALRAGRQARATKTATCWSRRTNASATPV
jgi:hypothetical protein